LPHGADENVTRKSAPFGNATEKFAGQTPLLKFFVLPFAVLGVREKRGNEIAVVAVSQL